MKRLMFFLILGLAGWQVYGHYQRRPPAQELEAIHAVEQSVPSREIATSPSFKCDGRTYCSQMTSCAEATFFLKNCPGVKMDGNNDGVPCEQQWCR
jgi:hypothetical protein